VVGGGVAIYLRAHIPFKVICTSQSQNPSHEAEYLFIEVTLAYTPVLLGVFYCPSSKINYFSLLENVLEDITPSYQHT
ncbi:hypothetical protein, partial [Proteus terrae]|uniref:hypothetical protein n=1 Tax=Proteus terrae TaxID=1574161 RepID=UPI00301BA1A0